MQRRPDTFLTSFHCEGFASFGAVFAGAVQTYISTSVKPGMLKPTPWNATADGHVATISCGFSGETGLSEKPFQRSHPIMLRLTILGSSRSSLVALNDAVRAMSSTRSGKT